MSSTQITLTFFLAFALSIPVNWYFEKVKMEHLNEPDKNLPIVVETNSRVPSREVYMTARLNGYHHHLHNLMETIHFHLEEGRAQIKLDVANIDRKMRNSLAKSIKEILFEQNYTVTTFISEDSLIVTL